MRGHGRRGFGRRGFPSRDVWVERLQAYQPHLEQELQNVQRRDRAARARDARAAAGGLGGQPIYGFGTKLATGDAATEPFVPRATATPWTRSRFRKRPGSRNAR